MVIGILGKGGSGKSTISSQIALHLLSLDKRILGIDADYNMDFVFNIFNGNVPGKIPYFGESRKTIREFLYEKEDVKYSDLVLNSGSQVFNFSKDHVDDFTKKYLTTVEEKMEIIVCGPENHEILNGKACGHSLSAPLKTYLPLLKVGEDCHVIIDEKAGSDGINSGVVSGCDMVFVVTDASLHGTKTAIQIAKLADFFNIPYKFVSNKVNGTESLKFIEEQVDSKTLVFNLDEEISINPKKVSSKNSIFFKEIENILKDSDNKKRFIRSKEKFLKQKSS